MKLFLDTEFTQLDQAAKLLSIGLVSEEGHTFYAEVEGIDYEKLRDWLKENVIPGFRFRDVYQSNPELDFDHHAMKGSKAQIAYRLGTWLGQWEEVQIWTDCGDYDWVLFCELWGGSTSLPMNVSYLHGDLVTLLWMVGVDLDCNRREFIDLLTVPTPHNALQDAKVLLACYRKAMALWQNLVSPSTHDA